MRTIAIAIVVAVLFGVLYALLSPAVEHFRAAVAIHASKVDV